MSKAKNKKQRQEKPEDKSPPADSIDKDAALDMSEEKSRDAKNENMFRMWNARPTRVPSVPKSKDSKVQDALPKHPIDWKKLSIGATMVCILAVFAHIMGLFGQFVLNDQLVLTPLKIGATSDVFWSTLIARGLATPLSGLWTNIGLATDLKSGSLIWFHIVNLTLHAATSVYLFFFLFSIGRYWKLEHRIDVKPLHFAFAAACMFACHPLASEVISYIPARETALVGANYILALSFFFAGFIAQKPADMILRYTLMFPFVVMGVLSGPAILSLPLAMACVAALAKPPEMEWSEFFKLRWPDFTIIGILSGAFIYVITMGIPTALNNGIGLGTLPFASYLASQFKAFATYFLRCFIVPGGLSIEPPLVVANSFADPLALLGVAAVGAVCYLAYRFREIPPVVLGLVLSLVGLLPDFVLPQSEVVSDARYYIPLVGLAIVFGWGASKMAMLSLKQVTIAIAVLFVGFAGLSNWRALAWESEEKVWKAVLVTNKDSARAHAKLALFALTESKKDIARKEVDAALKLDANSPLAHFAQGRLEQSELHFPEAYTEFETALKLAKEQNASPVLIAQCQAQVADSLVRQNDFARVKPMVEEAMAVLGQSAQLHYLMGMTLLHEKQFVTALYELQQGFVQDQRNEQYMEPIAEAYLGSRMPHMIPQAYQIMEKMATTLPTKHSLLLYARAALEMDKVDQAKDLIDKAVLLGGEDAEVFYLRSFIAKAKNDSTLAASLKAKALKLDPKIETNVPVLGPDEMQKYIDIQRKQVLKERAGGSATKPGMPMKPPMPMPMPLPSPGSRPSDSLLPSNSPMPPGAPVQSTTTSSPASSKPTTPPILPAQPDLSPAKTAPSTSKP